MHAPHTNASTSTSTQAHTRPAVPRFDGSVLTDISAFAPTFIARESDGSPLPRPQPPPELAADQFAPLSWEQYFDAEHDLSLDDTGDVFRLYTAGDINNASNSSVMLLIHGGGQSSLSWALCASRLKSSIPVIAVDLRGHGDTRTSRDSNLSTSQLVTDLVTVVKKFYSSKLRFDSLPSIVIAGHSLGGALAIRMASAATDSQLVVTACIVLDVVENTALSAIHSMHSLLAHRPQSFLSLSDCVQWAIRSSMVRSVESARVSVPSQFIYDSDAQCYQWRTDLLASQSYWTEWFTGLSSQFLALKCPKLLILADVDRLDREMSIAHMQGKIQVAIMVSAGHQIMEDQPNETARIMLGFWQRHAFGSTPQQQPLRLLNQGLRASVAAGQRPNQASTAST